MNLLLKNVRAVLPDSIEVGKAADLVLLDEEMNVLETYVDGICYRKD